MCAASPDAERDSTAGSGWCSTSAPTTDPNLSSVRSALTTAPGGTILGQTQPKGLGHEIDFKYLHKKMHTKMNSPSIK